MAMMLVSIRDLTLRLPSGGRLLTVLDGVSLEVAAGEAVAVAGPSGSGKSTLLGLIAGLDAPTSGTIVVAGVEVTRLGEPALARFRRETIGYVFQSYHLIPTLTAVENVMVPLDLAGAPAAAGRAAALLAGVGLAERGHHYPAQLSGGEQQRVALARAMALDPPLLLVDEPSAGLDPITADEIDDLLLTQKRDAGTTLVVVTHNIASARKLADNLIMLHEGRVIAEGTLVQFQQSDDPLVRAFMTSENAG
jgi:putative ABC transport system ATP-binding protein